MPILNTRNKPAFTNERRRFLNTCLVLGGSSFVPAAIAKKIGSFASTVVSQQGMKRELFQWRMHSVGFKSLDEYHEVRKRFALNAINPFLRKWLEETPDYQPILAEALVEAHFDNDEVKFGALLDYMEWFDEYNINNEELSIKDWMGAFQPVSRDDFLMALPLYRWHRATGKVVQKIQPTPDPWLDAMLAPTRGILLWYRSQWLELIRMSGCEGGLVGAADLLNHYIMGRKWAPEKLGRLIYPPTGQSVMEIIKERSLDGYLLGCPDFVAGDWLYRYYR